MARIAAFIVAALAACASAFAPAAAPQTLRAAPLDAKLSLPKLSAPKFSAPVSKGPIRGPNPNKGGSRVVGKAGYTIGDKVDAAEHAALGECLRTITQEIVEMKG